MENRCLRAIAAIAISIASLSACSTAQNLDLSAVQKYATTTEAARTSFDAIAADLDESCERSRELLLRTGLAQSPRVPMPDTSSGQQPNDSKDPAAVPTPEPSPTPLPDSTIPSPVPTRTPFFKDAALERCIEVEHPDRYPVGIVSNDWRKANDAMLAFVKGIGAIANVDSDPKNLKKLTGAIVDGKYMTKDQATAVNGVVTGIVGYFARQQERREIARFVKSVSDDFPNATAGLLKTADAYGEIVYAERTITDNFYNRSVRSLLNGSHHITIVTFDSKGAPHKLELVIDEVANDQDHQSVVWGRQYAIYRMRQEWRNRIADCDRRFASVEPYKNAVRTIANTEQQLSQSSEQKLTNRDLLAQVKRDVGDLSDSIDKLYSLLFPAATSASSGH